MIKNYTRLLLAALFLFSIQLSAQGSTATDREALIAFYNATDGTNWLRPWDLNANMNTWYGITLDANDRVTGIQIWENKLNGFIPPEIGDLNELKSLEILNFSNSDEENKNQLTENFPFEITNLSNLESIRFSNITLGGELPIEFWNLAKLKDIRFFRAELSGTIPDEIGNLPDLESFDIYDNDFTGTIPLTIVNCQNLSTFRVPQNQLEGEIPIELLQLTSLASIDIYNNKFTGTIPEELGLLNNLINLNLGGNSFTGPIPTELAQLENLEFLGLSFNNFEAPLPPELGLLSNLKNLDTQNAGLTGTIPLEIAELPLLESISILSNHFSGKIPNFTSPNLTKLTIGSNNFVFEDIIELSQNTDSSVNFYYSNQRNIGDTDNIQLNNGEEFTISVTETTDNNNTYQWRKDEVNIVGASESTFTVFNVQSTDAAEYDCLINNTILPELELTKNPITLTVVADSDNDGVNDNQDLCPNTPTGIIVDSQGCPITIAGQTNFLQNFSFEDWSGNPLTPDNWTITNANSIIRNTEATDGNYSLEIDLNNSLQFKTELQNTATIQLATNTTYTYSFDYKIKRGDNVSAEIQISKDGNPFGIRIADEFVGFDSDGAWHNVSFEFDTNDIDEDHIFKLVIRANTSITGIIQIDNMRVLGEALADTDNDGVLDGNDLCPNTPSTALAVDEDGCEINVDTSNLLEDPSFEDWSLNNGTNLRNWGINIIPGSSWNKNEDISDDLQYSLELTTGDNGSNASSIFQNDIELFNGVEYIISVDYKVLEGTFNSLELELTTGFFETFKIFTIDPADSGWQTLTRTFTADSNAIADLRVAVVSNLAQRKIILDNMVLKVNVATTDTDNDGVADTDDDCPNTPTGDTVDANGCTITEVADSDNDGVADTNDDCPDTPTGDMVDTNGCSITTVTDTDNDGVADTNDDCPNTPTGDTVDENGCTIFENTAPDIPNDGIQVKVTSTSCPNTANGEISVSFTEDYNYTVQITGILLDNTFDNINASNGLVRSDLSYGSYTVCVKIPEYPTYEQCYTVTIETPEEFISGKTVIDYTAKKASVVVSGSKNYQVLVNDNVYSFEVDNIANQQLSFPLDKGANVISIETDKICQGLFNDSVVISNAILSPNPVADILRVEGLDIMTEAQIILSNVSGVTTLQESRQINHGTLEMNISNLSPGIYMLTIVEGDKEINLKFVKK
ncbi:thrombospondin type 3 repeat-containing protein [uncultured Maribacter sp.]|uniref:thrombospondin type 3 repeat-containing protein n=1 Tax=uncultured Maribacter sp. TaxID=431308 RepID=UPI00261488BE|nr:thrombospondin type 3 repeat-containing protein [uncultured Maribacter sp.]